MANEIIEVQAELARRISAIAWRSNAGQVAREVDAIRAIAHRNGMQPAVTVAKCLEAALSRGERGAMISGWLALLGEAVASERQDAAAGSAFAAACSVRLAG